MALMERGQHSFDSRAPRCDVQIQGRHSAGVGLRESGWCWMCNACTQPFAHPAPRQGLVLFLLWRLNQLHGLPDVSQLDPSCELAAHQAVSAVWQVQSMNDIFLPLSTCQPATL